MRHDPLAQGDELGVAHVAVGTDLTVIPARAGTQSVRAQAMFLRGKWKVRDGNSLQSDPSQSQTLPRLEVRYIAMRHASCLVYLI